MKKYIPYMVMVLLCSLFRANAQTIVPLKIGDKIPEAVWNMPLQVINHPAGKQTITLNDYKGKLIILDFWATWCGSCIALMPKMDKIQKEFKSAAEVILVTKESKRKAEGFFSKRQFKLLSIIEDSLLNLNFPHLSIPHYVLIKPDGSIAAITSSDQITNENIKQLISGSDSKMLLKNDKDTTTPLFSSPELPFSQLRHYSIFLNGKLNDYPGSVETRRYNNDGIYGISYSNNTLFTLFKAAFTNLYPHLKNKRIIIEANDSSKLYYTQTSLTKEEWFKNNLYSYEILLPKSEADQIYYYMLTDINRYSDFTGEMAMRKVTCLKLVIKNTEKLNLKRLAENTGSKIKLFKNVPINALVDYLDGSLQIPFVVLDGTGYTGKINIGISANFRDLDSIRAELKQYDLDLIKDEQEIEFFVISQKVTNPVSFLSNPHKKANK